MENKILRIRANARVMRFIYKALLYFDCQYGYLCLTECLSSSLCLPLCLSFMSLIRNPFFSPRFYISCSPIDSHLALYPLSLFSLSLTSFSLSFYLSLSLICSLFLSPLIVWHPHACIQKKVSEWCVALNWRENFGTTVNLYQ